MATGPQVTVALKILVAAFPAHKATPETLGVYALALSDLEYEVLTRAILWCVTHCRFFPTVAEIREAVGDSSENRAPSVDEAWGEILCQVRKVGSYGVPTFSHPAIAQAVRAIDWREICLSDEIGVVRGHFIKLYQAYEKRARDRQMALHDNHPIMGAISQMAERMALPGSRA